MFSQSTGLNPVFWSELGVFRQIRNHPEATVVRQVRCVWGISFLRHQETLPVAAIVLARHFSRNPRAVRQDILYILIRLAFIRPAHSNRCVGRTRSTGAEGETAPETLRHKDRHNEPKLWRVVPHAPAEGIAISGTRTEGASHEGARPFRLYGAGRYLSQTGRKERTVDV